MTIKTKSDFLNAIVQAKFFPEHGEYIVQNHSGSVYACPSYPARAGLGWTNQVGDKPLRLLGTLPLFLGWHTTTITYGDVNAFLHKIGHKKHNFDIVKSPANYVKPSGHFDVFLAKGYINKAKNAEDRKLDFNLDLNDWREIFTTPFCPVTGRKLLVGTRKDGVPCPDDLLTVERLNPRLGYVKGNVVAMSYVANNAKSHLDQFVHLTNITDAEKVKLLRKSLYQLEKEMKAHG